MQEFRSKHERIAPVSSAEPVVPCTDVERIGTFAATQAVVAVPYSEHVIADSAEERVVAISRNQNVIVLATVEYGVAIAPTGIHLVEHEAGDGAIIFEHACKLGLDRDCAGFLQQRGNESMGVCSTSVTGIHPCCRAIPGRVESRCGALTVGRTYLLPPLSSGGALVVRPWLRFHIPLIERTTRHLGSVLVLIRMAENIGGTWVFGESYRGTTS